MKANAPERIWIDPANDLPKLSGHTDKDSVEYIRKDTFIEAVANWMSDTLQTVSEVETTSAHHVESIPALGIITQTEFIEKFKKEIMFLLD
jgi:hypothetical protein